MFEHVSFDQVRGSYLKTLEQYVPIVARVHGAIIPNFMKSVRFSMSSSGSCGMQVRKNLCS